MGEGLAAQATAIQGFDPFRAMELYDDKLIMDELNNRISKTWAYSFQQDGKTVTGLSKVGVDQACRHLATQGEIIREEHVEYAQDPIDPNYILFTAYASRYAVSKDGQEICLERVSGAKRQCIYVITRSEGMTDRVNPFWYEQGSMKAFRNARFRLLSESIRAQVIAMAVKAGNVKQLTEEDDLQGKQPPSPPQSKSQIKDPDAPSTEAQQGAVHSLYKKAGFQEDKFYDYIYEVIGRAVKSTKELTKGEASRVIEKIKAHGGEA